MQYVVHLLKKHVCVHVNTGSEVIVIQWCPALCGSMEPCQAPLSREFSRQGYWSGLPFPNPWDLPYAGIEPGSPILQADSLPFEPPGRPYMCVYTLTNLAFLDVVLISF